MLIEALDNLDPAARRYAASRIKYRKDAASAVPKLIEKLKDPDEVMRKRAAVALGEIGDLSAVDPLIDSLNDLEIRKPAATSLGQLGDKRAKEPLLKALHEANSEDERWAIWYALGNLGFKDEILHLVHLLDTPNWTARPEDRRAMLEPNEKPVRKLSAEQVKKIKSDIAEFASPVKSDFNKAVTRLSRRRGQVVEFLAEATASPNLEVRYGALFALDYIADPRAYPVILEMTKDPYPDLRWWALDFLGRLGGERAIPVLIDALTRSKEDDYGDRSGAMDGLGEVGKPVIPVLLEAMKTGDKPLRINAAYTLGRIEDESVFEPISKLLSDSDPEIREAGIDVLGIVGDNQPQALGKRSLMSIEEMLDDPEESVRESAASALDYLRKELERIGVC